MGLSSFKADSFLPLTPITEGGGFLQGGFPHKVIQRPEWHDHVLPHPWDGSPHGSASFLSVALKPISFWSSIRHFAATPLWYHKLLNGFPLTLNLRTQIHRRLDLCIPSSGGPCATWLIISQLQQSRSTFRPFRGPRGKLAT